MRGFVTSYENANQRFEQSQKWNDAHGFKELVVPQDNYTLFTIADSHIGGTENFKTFLQDAQNQNGTAIVLLGDVVNGHKKDYDVLASQLSTVNTIPSFALAGNHELYFGRWQHFISLFGTAAYYFAVKTPTGSDLYFCLDTSGGTLGDKQLKWFKEKLESMRDNYRNCIVLTHNNILRHRPTMSTNLMVQEIHVFTDLLLRYNIAMVVVGHDHIRNKDVLGNTMFVVMDAAFDGFSRASYLKINNRNGNVGYEFVDF